MTELVLEERRGPALWITMNRPEKLNALSGELVEALRASFRRASFRDASDSPFNAMWSRASFRCECGFTASGEVDPTRASFRRVSFRRTTDFGR